jgi:hypothetical protein
MVVPETYGSKVLYKSACGMRAFSNTSFEVGPVMVQRTPGMTS